MKNIIAFKTKNEFHYLYSTLKKRFYLIDSLSFEIFNLIKNKQTNNQIIEYFQKKNINELKLKYLRKEINEAIIKINDINLVNSRANWNPNILINHTAKQIKEDLFNDPHIVFEVTEKCNLACEYCCYGPYYQEYNARFGRDLSLNYSKRLLNFIVNNDENIHSQKITISFYGGEPLLRIDFIKEIVETAKKMLHKDQVLRLAMTTNGTLLKNHLEYLIDNDFNISISLDGNKNNNSYRKYKNGKNSFDKIFQIVTKIKDEHPDFFQKNINFLSVLHNRNSIKESSNYIYNVFGKYSEFSEISPDLILPSKRDDFMKIYKNKFEDLMNTPDYYLSLKEDHLEKTPEFDSSLKFFKDRTTIKTSNIYDINGLSEEFSSIIPTGSCRPFQKKIFLTANNKLLICERTNPDFAFGFISKDGINLNFEEIAKTHNSRLTELSKQCSSCYHIHSCPVCIFTLENTDNFSQCNNYSTRIDLEKMLSEQIGLLESNNEIIEKIYEKDFE